MNTGFTEQIDERSLFINICVNICALLDCGQQQISSRSDIAKLR